MMKFASVFLFLAWGTAVWGLEASSVRITESDGNVVIRKSGAQAWRAAREGDIVERGDRVAARSRSAALLLWSNGSMVKLYPDTEIALTGVTFDLANRMETTLLELERGRLFVKAQVPEHLFTDFKIRMGALEARTQGAEFAIAPDAQRKSFTAWVLHGRVTSDLTAWARARIDEGHQATIATGSKPDLANLNKPMDDRTWQSLAKVSRDLGGSLRTDEIAAGPGGKLVARIGGVRSRRGNAPYVVSFKALTAGGSGRIKSILWEFGDGVSATGREAEHAFTLGLYTVVLRVEDASGQKASAQIGILAQVDCGC